MAPLALMATRSRAKSKKASKNVAIAIGFVICRRQSVKVLKYVQRFIRFQFRPSLPMFVYVAVCLFLFLWLFLSAKITDKRCWSKWKGDSASSPSPSPICMWVVLKCCARRLLYMALLSMSVSRHQCVCVIQLITTYMGSHMHWEKIYINLHISKHTYFTHFFNFKASWA